MTESELRAVLRADDVPSSLIPRGAPMQMLVEVAGLYEREGLLGASRRYLPRCCALREQCWKGHQWVPPRRNESRWDGGISLPWIGPRYRPGGLAIIGINFNDTGGLTAAFTLARDDCSCMKEGYRKVRYGLDWDEYPGSQFPYGSARAATAVIDRMSGRRAKDHDDPAEVADVLLDVVRVQSVKCAPTDTTHGAPYPRMKSRCPDFLLLGELTITEPSVVLGFGKPVRDFFLAHPRFGRAGASTFQGRLGYAPGRSAKTFLLSHPNSGTFAADLRRLCRALNDGALAS